MEWYEGILEAEGQEVIWKVLRQFCRNDEGGFDFLEFHAIVLGLFFPFILWPFMFYHLRHMDSGEAAKIARWEPHYLAFGMALRALCILAILIWRGIL